VASTTRSAANGPASVAITKRSSSCCTCATRWAVRTSAPASVAARTSASSTVAARPVVGNSFPSGSSRRSTPMPRKNAMVSSTVHACSTRAIARREPPLKSAGRTTRLVTLQRPPPLIRIFRPSCRAPSSTVTAAVGHVRRATMAVMRPAAPAPTMTTRGSVGGLIIGAACNSYRTVQLPIRTRRVRRRTARGFLVHSPRRGRWHSGCPELERRASARLSPGDGRRARHRRRPRSIPVLRVSCKRRRRCSTGR
jgi:hypothetical protein